MSDTPLMLGSAPPAATPTSTHEGPRETIESIIIALILAFVFRAFVVEAFVIPTGSMAPTLYGAHGTLLCEDCGTEFAYGLRDVADKRSGTIDARARAICPNCNHPNTDLRINDVNRNAETGDRILVLKWPFDIGGKWLDPARWDVIVFKDPCDTDPADGVTNFIKRLAGLPNEVLMIVDGDVYTTPKEKLSPEATKALEERLDYASTFRTGERSGRVRMLSDTILSELDEKLQIARKTPEAQEELWWVVYDHDHLPREWNERQPKWRAGSGEASGWEPAGRRIRFEDQKAKVDFIQLEKELVASNAYNLQSTSPPPVADVRVRFVLTPTTPDGFVRVRLTKFGRAIWATIRMDGRISIESSDLAAHAPTNTIAESRVLPFEPGKSVTVNVENVDYRAAVVIGGKEIVATSSDPHAPSYYGPSLKLIRVLARQPVQPPRIYASEGDFELNHLVVERDIYYYQESNVAATPSWGPPLGWGSVGHPILLREDEFFMLGDNTAASKDSRLWDEIGPHLSDRADFQLGTVPRDQLIGKAFFVYWPMGKRIPRFPILDRIGLVPDVGRMRWIR